MEVELQKVFLLFETIIIDFFPKIKSKGLYKKMIIIKEIFIQYFDISVISPLITIGLEINKSLQNSYFHTETHQGKCYNNVFHYNFTFIKKKYFTSVHKYAPTSTCTRTHTHAHTHERTQKLRFR